MPASPADGEQQLERVARFVVETKWRDLPAKVQERARFCLVDNVAAAICGTLTPVAHIAAEFAANRFPGRESTVLQSGEYASAEGAAFANGVAANGTDVDDCGLYTWGHPGAQVIAACLSAGEACLATGEQLMAATVVGYEIMFRAGRCWYDADPLLRGCGSWGSLGCAAIAGNLWGLTLDQSIQALGIAEYHAPCLPLMRDVRQPRMVKHGIGMGAFNGLMSADLARRGYTGVTPILGFLKYREWVEDIGTHFIMPYGFQWKEFSCCAWAHSPLYAIRKLLEENPGLRADDVEEIEIETYEEASELGTSLPSTTEEAQFNLAWPVAALLVAREVGPRQVLEEGLQSEAIRSVAERTTVIVSDELTRLYRLAEVGDPEGKDAAQVRLRLRDGQKLASGLVQQPLYAQEDQGWDRSQMEGKFRWLMQHVSVQAGRRADGILDVLWNAEKLDSVIDLAMHISAICRTAEHHQGAV